MKINYSTKIILSILLFVAFNLKTNAQTSVSSGSLQVLKEILQKDQRATKIWWNSWLGLYSVGTIVQAGIAIQTDNKAIRQDMILGAVTTILGSGSQLLTPMVKVDKNFLYSTDLLNIENQEEFLKIANDLLKKSAEFEQAGRSWQTHALTGTMNVAGGLITWLAFDRTLKDGIINFAINTAVTELQIWSQPIIAKKTFEKLNSQFETIGYYQQKKTHTTLTASAIPSGFQLKIVF